MNTSLTLAIVNDVFMVCLDYILKVKQGSLTIKQGASIVK